MKTNSGFKDISRELPGLRNPKLRTQDYQELYEPFPKEKTKNQAMRCMDCGIPFCHNGCPLGNIIPEFNEAVQEENWKKAYEILSLTNNFPEFTGRICPAPCEASCVLGIINTPVAIEHIEKSIIEVAFTEGYIQPSPPEIRTGKKIAVVGSGPSGLATAAQLNKAGHLVTVFERADQPGGLLRYGIPDFKLDKKVLDRRIDLMKKEGILFQCNTNIGHTHSALELEKNYDAIVLCGGATIPRDLGIPGRNLKGVHYAMEFLEQSNKKVGGRAYSSQDISAFGKNVLVIGGGDTGSDCVGTSNRQKARSVHQIELLVKPPQERDARNPWPLWPMILRTSSSHEEGCDREWAVQTKRFIGNEENELIGVELVDIEWKMEGGRPVSIEKEGSSRIIPCELALLAIGFMHPEQEGALKELSLELDPRGNVKTPNDKTYSTSRSKIFAAGDMRRGQSLVVWAISEGREAARQVDLFLMGESSLESKDSSYLQMGDEAKFYS